MAPEMERERSEDVVYERYDTEREGRGQDERGQDESEQDKRGQDESEQNERGQERKKRRENKPKQEMILSAL